MLLRTPSLELPISRKILTGRRLRFTAACGVALWEGIEARTSENERYVNQRARSEFLRSSLAAAPLPAECTILAHSLLPRRFRDGYKRPSLDHRGHFAWNSFDRRGGRGGF